MAKKVQLEKFMGKSTLIVGGINTGKTRLSKMILDEFCAHSLGRSIAVIDMAPEIPRETALKRGLQGVGGTLIPPEEQGVLYLKAKIKPPRLSSKSEEQAILIANENIPVIERLFQIYMQSRRHILFINDISLYLQAGSTARMTNYLKKAQTIVANGYLGDELGKGPLSEKEAREMKALAKYFDAVIRL